MGEGEWRGRRRVQTRRWTRPKKVIDRRRYRTSKQYEHFSMALPERQLLPVFFPAVGQPSCDQVERGSWPVKSWLKKVLKRECWRWVWGCCVIWESRWNNLPSKQPRWMRMDEWKNEWMNCMNWMNSIEQHSQQHSQQHNSPWTMTKD